MLRGCLLASTQGMLTSTQGMLTSTQVGVGPRDAYYPQAVPRDAAGCFLSLQGMLTSTQVGGWPKGCLLSPSCSNARDGARTILGCLPIPSGDDD